MMLAFALPIQTAGQLFDVNRIEVLRGLARHFVLTQYHGRADQFHQQPADGRDARRHHRGIRFS